MYPYNRPLPNIIKNFIAISNRQKQMILLEKNKINSMIKTQRRKLITYPRPPNNLIYMIIMLTSVYIIIKL